MKLFFIVLLAVLIGALSYFVVFYSVRGTVLQHVAESYPHVQGTVLSSQVTITHGSKGRVYYHPRIDYRYTVGDSEYTGSRYRYDDQPTGSGSAYAIVNSHPPGSAVDVYYNPADPTDTVISPGVVQQDMLLSFLILAAILFLWSFLLKWAQQQPGLPWTGSEATGGVVVITDMLLTRLRLPRYPPVFIALVTTAILMLSAAAVTGTGLLTTPLWATGECALAIALIGGAAVYAWLWMDVHSGKRDLVIDEGARTVQLPLTYGRREQAPVSFSQIQFVLLNRITHRTKNGYYYTCMVTLEMADDSQQKLIDLKPALGESLGTWLREKLGLAERAVGPAEN
ncbi:MAG TPA: DUF3592 domain-containing protein [Verrucomicrobiae bacterium]|jgi:hypothetical protein